MNIKRKKYLNISSIISIVNAGIAFVLGIILVLSAMFYTESDMIEMLKEKDGYQFEREADGGYSIIYCNDDGDIVIVQDEDMEHLIAVTTKMNTIEGSVAICFSVAKMVLAILVLTATYREKYSKGCVIALLVLCCMITNILEIVFLAMAISAKDETTVEVTNNNVENNENME